MDVSCTKKFQEIVDKYSGEDVKVIHDTVETLVGKGVPNGCYQDYTVLTDVISVLTLFESAVKNKGLSTEVKNE